MNKERGYCIENDIIKYQFMQLTKNNVKEFIDFIYSGGLPVSDVFKEKLYKRFLDFNDVLYCYEAETFYEEEGFDWFKDVDFDCYSYEIGDYAVLSSGNPDFVSKQEFEEEYLIIN